MKFRTPSLRSIQRFSMHVDLSSEEMTRIEQAATRRELSPEQLVKRFILGKLTDREMADVVREIGKEILDRVIGTFAAEIDKRRARRLRRPL